MIPAQRLHQYALEFAPHAYPSNQRTPIEVYEKIPQSLSAALLTDGRFLWVGSDESCTIERFTLADWDNFKDHQHFVLTDYLDLPAGSDHEVDIEGLDYQPPYLWVVGSHSYKRKKLKTGDGNRDDVTAALKQFQKPLCEANRYLLARIPLVDGLLHRAYPPENPTLTAACFKISAKGGNDLISALEKDPHLGAVVASQIPGKENGLDIEGIAILSQQLTPLPAESLSTEKLPEQRPEHPSEQPLEPEAPTKTILDPTRLVLGLRGPVLRGWAVLLELEIRVSPKGNLKLNHLGKHFLNLDGLGIRDLLLQGDDLLILAGPTMNLDGPVRLYRLRGGLPTEGDTPQQVWRPDYVMDLPYAEGADHAEGITLASFVTDRPALLAVYDAPSPQRHFSDPTRVLIDLLALP
jgi:hypothetical protein